MDKNEIIEQTKQHIHNLRKNSSILQDRDFKIALGKVIIDLKDAKKYDKNILKTIFSLGDKEPK